MTAPTSSSSTPAASSTAPSRNRSAPSARPVAENGKVIVTGCMGAEPEQIEAGLSGRAVDHRPAAGMKACWSAVHRALPPVHNPHLDLVPPQGIKLTPRHYAYLKISEGCNNRCSFCIIPKLRGDLVSRPANDVLREAEKLVAAGVKELLVISQDTSAYGVDIKYAASPVEGPPGPRQVLRPRARNSATSAPGRGCNMSTPTRMSMKSSA